MEPRALLCSLLALGCASLAVPSAAVAQPAPAAPPPAAPPSTSLQLPAAAPDPIAIALAPKPGGLTPEAVAKVVSRTKHSVRAKQEELRAAAARVDSAFVGFFPKLSVQASYTRLSPVNVPNLGTLVVTQNPGLVPISTVDPGTTRTVTAPGQPAQTFTCDAATSPAGCYGGLYAAPLSFPTPLNATSIVASIAVPISDYVFKLSQTYAAASHNEKSARLSADAEALQAGADAKIAYFNWAHAKGGVVVAADAIEQAKAHLDDAKKSFAVGLASRADVLRIDAQVAAAQQSHAEAVAFAAVAEEQLRTLLGVPSGQPLEIGSDVMNGAVVAPTETLDVLQEQALARRLEIRALDETVYSMKQAESATAGSYSPRIEGFADATIANPNQRIFPLTQTWAATWDVGVRLSWTLNDVFTTRAAVGEAKARTATVIEQKGMLRDSLRVEVASAYADAMKAPPTIEAADRGMISAEESLRVRRELFRNGKATSSELVDAEAELTRARLRRLDAHVGLLVAKARLDHAVGRDAPARPVNE